MENFKELLSRYKELYNTDGADLGESQLQIESLPKLKKYVAVMGSNVPLLNIRNCPTD
jgi:hypothetical protein